MEVYQQRVGDTGAETLQLLPRDPLPPLEAPELCERIVLSVDAVQHCGCHFSKLLTDTAWASFAAEGEALAIASSHSDADSSTSSSSERSTSGEEAEEEWHICLHMHIHTHICAYMYIHSQEYVYIYMSTHMHSAT